MKTISNSEVGTFMQCERKHYYGYILNLEPKSVSQALNRGIIAHDILASYYEAMRLGCDFARCKDIATKTWAQHFSAPYADTEMLMKLMNLLEQYWEYYFNDITNWEILAVEKTYYLPLTDEFSYGMRLDLLIRIKEGQYKGDVVVVDHKTVYDFWQQNQFILNPQLAKYITTVRQEGITVHRGMINELRHRSRIKPYEHDERYRRTFIRTSERKTRSIMREQIMASDRIAERHTMEPEQADRAALRIMSTMICKTCPFIYLCDAQLNGEPITAMVAAEFQPNTYNEGYAKLGEDNG